MRILLLTHRIPYPPDKGDKIRSFRLFEALAGRHDVRLITHADDPRDLAHVPELRRRCRAVTVHPRGALARASGTVRALLRGQPLSFGRFHDSAAAREVRDALENDAPDVVVVFSAQPAEYLPADLRVPVVVDLVDVDSEKWRAYAARARGPMRGVFAREHRLVAAFERGLAARNVTLSLVTEGEAALFRSAVADVPVAVVRNGVADPPARTRAPEDGVMLFAGAMDYAPNAEAAAMAALEVLPRVRQTVTGARLRIVGRNPTRAVRALASHPGVEVAGAVASLDAELDRAAVSLLPLRVVRGVPNKLLESLARAIPVVTTPAALDAIGGRSGVHAFACESADAMASAAVRLLADGALRARLGAAGQAFVREQFRWERFDEGMLGLVLAAATQEITA